MNVYVHNCIYIDIHRYVSIFNEKCALYHGYSYFTYNIAFMIPLNIYIHVTDMSESIEIHMCIYACTYMYMFTYTYKRVYIIL